MIGLDTNVWVRYVTNDDPRQGALAVQLIAHSDDIFLSRTVLLEIEWVLRGVYHLERDAVITALMQILGLSNVIVETPGRVAKALGYHRKGLDFADALHFSSSNYSIFHTFDAKFAKRGQQLQLPVELIGNR